MSDPNSETQPKKLTARQREKESLDLRMTGMTYQEIGDALGITRQGAHAAVVRALEKLESDIGKKAELVRKLELQRLDRLQRASWIEATRGNKDAIANILRIITMRLKLMGLEHPIQVSIENRMHLEIIEIIREGAITFDQLYNELQDYQLAKDLFEQAGKIKEVMPSMELIEYKEEEVYQLLRHRFEEGEISKRQLANLLGDKDLVERLTK